MIFHAHPSTLRVGKVLCPRGSAPLVPTVSDSASIGASVFAEDAGVKRRIHDRRRRMRAIRTQRPRAASLRPNMRPRCPGVAAGVRANAVSQRCVRTNDFEKGREQQSTQENSRDPFRVTARHRPTEWSFKSCAECRRLETVRFVF